MIIAPRSAAVTDIFFANDGGTMFLLLLLWCPSRGRALPLYWMPARAQQRNVNVMAGFGHWVRGARRAVALTGGARRGAVRACGA